MPISIQSNRADAPSQPASRRYVFSVKQEQCEVFRWNRDAPVRYKLISSTKPVPDPWDVQTSAANIEIPENLLVMEYTGTDPVPTLYYKNKQERVDIGPVRLEAVLQYGLDGVQDYLFDILNWGCAKQDDDPSDPAPPDLTQTVYSRLVFAATPEGKAVSIPEPYNTDMPAETPNTVVVQYTLDSSESRGYYLESYSLIYNGKREFVENYVAELPPFGGDISLLARFIEQNVLNGLFGA